MVELPRIVAYLGSLGFSGFETALAALPLHDPGQLRGVMASSGMTLAGAHAGGPWWRKGEDVAGTAERARQLPALGCQRLVVSCDPLPPSPSDDDFARLADSLGRLGRACAEHGVRVVFHNHPHELVNGARALRAIVERCEPEDLALGPDLGWVAYAGVDPVEFIAEFGSRIEYVHLRDLTSSPDGMRFTEVGRGRLPLDSVLDALAAVGFRGWLIAESEFGSDWAGEADPETTARLQYAGLHALVDRATRSTQPRDGITGRIHNGNRFNQSASSDHRQEVERR